MAAETVSRHERGEELRRRYLYRRLIVRGRLRLSRRGAARLIGPDCAYHLYRAVDGAPCDDAQQGGGDR